MVLDYRSAVRRSFIYKLAIYLQNNGSRDMSLPRHFSGENMDYLYGTTTYGIVHRSLDEDLFLPGINIGFIDEVDLSKERTTKKRYLLTTKIAVTKPIQGNITPTRVATEVSGVTHQILQALSDGHVEIWNYDLSTPAYTGVFGSYHQTGYKIADESLAVPGGDIRESITLLINYMDPSF